MTVAARALTARGEGAVGARDDEGERMFRTAVRVGAVASVPPICWYEPWKTPKEALPFAKSEWNQAHYSGIE